MTLRKALLKYKLHKDQVFFDRAYAYKLLQNRGREALD